MRGEILTLKYSLETNITQNGNKLKLNKICYEKATWKYEVVLHTITLENIGIPLIIKGLRGF